MVSATPLTFTASLFGRHVRRSSQYSTVHCHRDFIRFAFGQAKIHDMRRPISTEYDIRRLRIAMNDASLVRMMQSFDDGRTQVGNLKIAELICGQPVRKRHAVNQVADNIYGVILATDFVY